MRILDLFCGAGGAAKGYRDAGFEVVGVDINRQPNYPYEFHQADALVLLDRLLDGGYIPGSGWFLEDFDAIHASPVCKRWTAYNRRPGHVGEYPDLINPTRERLRESGVPRVIENVPWAPLQSPVILCGSAFRLDVQRHRGFESSIPLIAVDCNHGIWTPRFPPATNRR